MASSPFMGNVVIVTGGASGIGAALGTELGRVGANVVLADRQGDVAEEVAAEIRRGGGRAEAAELDVRDFDAVTRVVERTVARHGRLDVIFNNAGIAVGGEIDSYGPKDWDEVFDVNIRGVAYGIQAAYPVMIRQGSGHIVNTASMAGLVGAPAEGSYGAAKHAVVGLSKSLRIEAKRHGVKVSVLCPGAIRTPILTGGKFGRINAVGLSEEKMLELWSRMRPMPADVFARKALAAVARNEAIIVLPSWWKTLWYIERLSPALSAHIWERVLRRLRENLEAAGARPTTAAERIESGSS